MSEINKIKSDPSLRDDELDAATGGAFNAFANFSDIKGECTDTQLRTGAYSKTLTFSLSTTTP